MANDDSDFLMISGLKHFQFCRRRWALVHVEQLWEDCIRMTAECQYRDALENGDYTR